MKHWNRILAAVVAALLLLTMLPGAMLAEDGIALDATDTGENFAGGVRS